MENSMDEKLILNRDLILNAIDQKIEAVEMPEWGGVVHVRSLNGSERDSYEAGMVRFGADGKPKEVRLQNMRAKLCALTICDETGKRLFSDDDMDALSQKNASALQKIFGVAQRLSGLTKRDVDELVDGLKKGRSDGSTSG
jgi:hypothetical protein